MKRSEVVVLAFLRGLISSKTATKVSIADRILKVVTNEKGEASGAVLTIRW